VFVIIFLLQIGAIFAVSFAAVNLSKDSYVTNNQLTTKSGVAVQTASVDYCVLPSGTMTLRQSNGKCPSADENSKPPAIATTSVESSIKLHSKLPTSVLSELKSLFVKSRIGVEVFINVNGFIRYDSEHVKLLTSIGDLYVNGSILSFSDNNQEKYFERAGFKIIADVKSGSRRLQDSPTIEPTSEPASEPVFEPTSEPTVGLFGVANGNIPFESTTLPEVSPITSPEAFLLDQYWRFNDGYTIVPFDGM
jgi:hypothetical protein